MKFRNDINGLRAIAVIAVVIFHFNSAWLPGGFAGVDVFFVISGYLMTSIIYRGLDNQNFSLIKFYKARARRILPPLVTVCLILLVFGWFFIAPLDYSSLGKHITSSIGFFSNIVYWREAGYFNAASHEKWLLHTWSLSVEWQFYMLYPIALILFQRFIDLKNIRWVLLIATVVGFLFSIYASYRWPNAAFYLLPTRAWEMMVGGLAFFFPLALSVSKQRIMEWLGLALILSSYVIFSKYDMWPGYLALVPVLGTFFVIIAARNNSWLTNNPLSQFIGTISYSVYLWHWVIYVMLKYLGKGDDIVFVISAIFFSLVTGYLSYKYVEQLINTPKNDRSSRVIIDSKSALASFFFIVVLTGGAISIPNGFPSRFNADVIIAEAEAKNKDKYHELCNAKNNKINWFPDCIYVDESNLANVKPSLILIGDSHAGAVVTSVAKSANKQGHPGVLLNYKHGCMTVPNVMRFDGQQPDCSDYSTALFEKLRSANDHNPVLIVNRLGSKFYGVPADPAKALSYVKGTSLTLAKENLPTLRQELRDNYTKEICSLTKNRKVFVLKPIPEMEHNVPKYFASQKIVYGDKSSELTLSKSHYDERNAYILDMLDNAARQCGITLLDPTEVLCDKQSCKGTHNGRPIYYDDNHLSEYGNKLLVPIFDQIWNDGDKYVNSVSEKNKPNRLN